MADDISRRIEESLAQHRQLVEQTRRIMEERNADTEHQSGDNQFAAQEEEQHLTFGNLKEQTGILGEPDLTLVSLDSTLAQETEDNRNGNNSSPFTSVSVMTTSGSAPADSTSLISTSCPLTTTPTSTTQSSGYMNVMFRDPTTGSQVQESLGRSDGDVESEIVHESDANVPNAPASELHGTTPHQHGIGARPKQVKFEITGESSESGRCRTVEQQCDDTMDSSHQDSDFISINVQHIDGSSTDEYEGLSLREAFMKKKRDFIEASEKRKKKAEEKAKRSAAKCQQQQQQQHSSLGKTLASWKKSRKLNNQPAAKRRDPTTVVERTSEQRKKDEREMKARTSRLYGRLEEVKQRKLEEERKRQYAENREKAKAFYQYISKSTRLNERDKEVTAVIFDKSRSECSVHTKVCQIGRRVGTLFHKRRSHLGLHRDFVADCLRPDFMTVDAGCVSNMRTIT
ncbi:hypothetical protein LSH36_64g02028 [Paralvinella palmiformis]|uniref:ALMS motif domain-containing protein n=1 Tax=Paralvinella palmiformis TaxID=53620 RepID=A0AAD9K423_9ANNE|nr:hypothetical protein LSH36_64g02028 [Paralvinella palmiformis]